MHVGIDYWPATTHAPGVGRYARELVRALAAQERGSDHALSLLSLGLGPQPVEDLGLEAPRMHIRRHRVPAPRRLMCAPWFPAADTLAGGVELFHHIIPGAARVRRARQTLALSEIPARGSEAASRLGALLRSLDAVLVFGEAAAAEASGTLDIAPERLRVVPVGCDHWIRAQPPATRPDEPPTLLVLGSPKPARQPQAILAAWDLLRARGLECRLRFVGAPVDGALNRQVMEREGVTHDLPPERELPAVVSHAAVLVHLHDAEATAVTPLEAFSFGLAVVASDLPAFREALDDEATLLETASTADDPERLADAVAAALDSAHDQDARARRQAIAARFTWQRNAEATLAVWEDVLASSAGR